jgi:hypothetical protein
MATRTSRRGGGALELLRPPDHRGPLIAAGTVVLAVGVALEEYRLSSRLAPLSHVLILGALTLLALGVGVQARPVGGRPPAFQSVLLVTGLLALYGALLRLADLLGADFSPLPAGALTWTALIVAAAGFWLAFARDSAVCLLIAAIATGTTVLAGVQWVFGSAGQGRARVLLLLMALAAVLAALALRGARPRHGEQLINAAGLAILAIPLVGLFSVLLAMLALFGTTPDPVLPNFWELVVLAAGCGLVAYGAVDRLPGAALLGVANLAAFVVVVGISPRETLLWWPLALIVVGLVAVGAGLRPRAPLPPEPDPYRAGEQPLSMRTAEEITLRVRDDSPPRG